MRHVVKLPSGRYFDLDNLERNIVIPHDVAYSLAHINRFTGHLGPYTVAQHSYMVSTLVPPEHAYDALMHEAAEVVLNDLSSPVKDMLPCYKALEKRLEEEFFRPYFGVRFGSSLVKRADHIMLATEKKWLGRQWGRQEEEHDVDDTWDMIKGVEPLEKELLRWSPQTAYRMFMQRYDEVKP